MTGWSFEASLRNGRRILVRPVTPQDRRLLSVGFDHLSDRSRYLRFLVNKKALTEDELNRFTAAESDGHAAFGALDIDAAPPRPAGIARYVCLPGRRDAAEIAITVVDSYQGQGLGSLLIGALACHAVAHGIASIVALVHEANAEMLHLFRQMGGREVAASDGEVELVIPLHRDPANYPPTKTGDAMRQAARLLEASRAAPHQG